MFQKHKKVTILYRLGCRLPSFYKNILENRQQENILLIDILKKITIKNQFIDD